MPITRGPAVVATSKTIGLMATVSVEEQCAVLLAQDANAGAGVQLARAVEGRQHSERRDAVTGVATKL